MKVVDDEMMHVGRKIQDFPRDSGIWMR